MAKSKQNPFSKTENAWIILAILFGIIGGAAGALLNYNNRPLVVKLLVIGLLSNTVIALVVKGFL